MENTIENKAKFFSQYLYQEVFCIKGWNRGKMICDPEKLNSEEHKYFKKSFLQLKPLSAISDEDFNKIVEIKESHNLPGTMIKGILSHKFFIQPQIDYLRSKGYLVPFNELSEDQILNRGWAVLEHPQNI